MAQAIVGAYVIVAKAATLALARQFAASEVAASEPDTRVPPAMRPDAPGECVPTAIARVPPRYEDAAHGNHDALCREKSAKVRHPRTDLLNSGSVCFVFARLRHRDGFLWRLEVAIGAVGESEIRSKVETADDRIL